MLGSWLYLPAVREALDRLNEATARLRASDVRGTLTVSVLPSFTARWLVPRLGRFREIHPEIDVRVAPTKALRWDARRWPRPTSVPDGSCGFSGVSHLF